MKSSLLAGLLLAACLAGCREQLPDFDDVFVRIIERHRASLAGAS